MPSRKYFLHMSFPFLFQSKISTPIEKLPINTALAVLIDRNADVEKLRPLAQHGSNDQETTNNYNRCMVKMEKLATFLMPTSSNSTFSLSRPMQRKLVNLLNTQLLEEEGRWRAIKAARSLGERSVTELILQHQNPQQLSANLWAAVRARGCQFLGPAMQEEVLKLVLLALEDGSALSRKVLVMFVVQRLEPQYPQASKTSIGHVVQLLYRASCFKVTKRDGDSSLMQLKEEFRSYDTLRREHDAQIVQIATEAGLRIAPDQWSSLLYGDSGHKSHMQSIIDKLQTPQSFVQSVQELVIALQRTSDPGHLGTIRPQLEMLSSIDMSDEKAITDWYILLEALSATCAVVSGLQSFTVNYSGGGKKHSIDHSDNITNSGNSLPANSRYKTSMCRDLAIHSSCPRGSKCTFAHSMSEMEMYRKGRPAAAQVAATSKVALTSKSSSSSISNQEKQSLDYEANKPQSQILPPVAQVAPVPREVTRKPATHPGQATSTPTVDMTGQQQSLQQQMAADLGGNTALPVALPSYMPIMEDHLQELSRNMPDPAGSTSRNNVPSTLATKSLPALRNRKEQIKGKLEDIVGRDETERLSDLYQQRAKGGKSAGALSMAIGVSSPPGTESLTSCYSIWTSRSVCSLTSTASTTTSNVISVNRRSEERRGLVSQEPQTGQSLGYTEEDDEVPFTDTPQVSRFGPISRRGVSIMRPSKPSQSLAPMGDEPMPIAVVRHSKQLAKQVSTPPQPAVLLQNGGGRTTLHPVTVGANGEIGYIAVQEPNEIPPSHVNPMVPPAPAPEQIHQAVPMPAVLQPLNHQQVPVLHHQPPLPIMQPVQRNSNVDASSVTAEYARMKHELGVLQQQISDLNAQQQQHQYQMMQQQELLRASQAQQRRTPEAQLQNDLTSELQLIEKTIRDREMEQQMNQCMTSDFPRGLDYGSYVDHGEFSHYSLSSIFFCTYLFNYSRFYFLYYHSPSGSLRLSFSSENSAKEGEFFFS